MTQADEGPRGGEWPPRPPGWYADPWYRGQHRLWTGSGWTADVFPDGPGVATQPVPGAIARLGRPPIHHTAAVPAPPRWYGPHRASPEPAAPTAVTEVLESPLRRPLSRWLVAAVALAIGAAVGFGAVYAAGGLGDRSSATTDNGASQGPALVPPPANREPSDPAASVLGTLVLHPSDVPTGVTVFVIPGGDQVGGEVTLDLCNGSFPSESLRAARLQVAASTATGDVLVSTEAVLYRSPAAAAQAMSELQSVTAHCPSTPVTSPVGEPTVTTTLGARPDRSWPAVPGVQRLAYDVTTTDASGTEEHSLAVYLRKGRVLVGVYLPQDTGTRVRVAGKTSPADVTAVFAARLQRLSSAVVNG